MARIKSRVRRFFSLLVPLLFISAVHAEQTPVPAKTVTVEAKNEVFAPQHPDQYLSWKATSEQSAREDALAEDPRLVIDPVGGISLLARLQQTARARVCSDRCS